MNTYYIKYLYLILVIILGGLIISLEKLAFSIAAICLIGLFTMMLVEFDILHPFVWFTPFFILYAIGFPVLNILGWYEIATIEEMNRQLYFNWIFYAVFIFTVSPHRVNYDIAGLFQKARELGEYKNIINTTLFLSVIVYSYYCIQLYNSGVTSKQDINKIGEGFSLMPVSLLIFFIFFALSLYTRLIERKYKIFLFALIALIWGIGTYTITGERDVVLRILAITIFATAITKIMEKRYVIAVGVVTLISLPILSTFKNVSLKGEGSDFMTGSFLVDLFRSEFSAQGYNLYYVNNYIINNSILFGETLIWDIKRGILGVGESPGAWFGRVFYNNPTSGKGFTLIGEGLLNFNTLGIVIWGLIFAITIRFLYRKSATKIYILISYVIVSPLFIYVLRADLASLFANVIKQIVIPLFIFFIFLRFLNSYKEKVHNKSSIKNIKTIKEGGING